jgi:hypothetical protein
MKPPYSAPPRDAFEDYDDPPVTPLGRAGHASHTAHITRWSVNDRMCLTVIVCGVLLFSAGLFIGDEATLLTAVFGAFLTGWGLGIYGDRASE